MCRRLALRLDGVGLPLRVHLRRLGLIRLGDIIRNIMPVQAAHLDGHVFVD